MEEYKFHIIALEGSKRPDLDSNVEKVAEVSREIIDLLSPARLAVFAPLEKEALSTAISLNESLGSSALSNMVAKTAILESGSLQKSKADQWLAQLQVLNQLVLIKDKQRGKGHNTGMVLVTSEDIVKGLPSIIGVPSYKDETKTGYAQANFLEIAVDDTGKIIEPTKSSKKL